MGEEYDGDDGVVNRRLRLALGAVAAVVIAGALVSPVVLSDGSSKGCSTTLHYLGQAYTVRAVPDNTFVQAIAVGVGVTRGCGTKPENVGVRSLVGVGPARAVAAAGSSAVYVRRGVCVHATEQALRACLRR